ncbi:MAG: hypothetical protein CM1200mP36_06290 [Gammaproteobacteria bacterium]|nr:MAG: hypothetical protein CM1200mP36_06290 [Gammaproteobacteria bacterium]
MWQFAWWWVLLALPIPWVIRRLSSADPFDRDAALKVPDPGEFGGPDGVRQGANTFCR